MRSKMTCLTIIILFIAAPSVVKSDFCDDRTTESYHAPSCNKIWVVRDPNRIDNLQIDHKPSYHTYSRWVIDEQTYIIAYRDIDYDPNDMVADIYLSGNGSYTLVGDIAIKGNVVNVFAAKLTSNMHHDLVFRFNSGQLQYVSVVKIINQKIIKVFEYGGTEIEINSEKNPMIIIKSKTPNIIQQYIWDSANSKFFKAQEFPWHK
ncbi:MAG: hypothetical protein AB1724_14710 [Thermodesulfobacteriota bacterium]